MKNNTRQSGYILLLTLGVTALTITLATYLHNRAVQYNALAKLVHDREKAQMLAHSGIQLACSQLSTAAQKQQGKTASETDHGKTLLATLLPVLNQWQDITFTKKNDALDGKLSLCVTCEDGKININELYDFKNKKFIPYKEATPANQKKTPSPAAQKNNAQELIKEICSRIEKLMGGAQLFDAFEKFLKARHAKLNDVTELLLIKEFDIFRTSVFYEPNRTAEKYDTDQNQVKNKLYLTDIFTLWSSNAHIEPWLLSNSVRTMLELSTDETEKITNDVNQVEKMLQNFTLKPTWNQAWDTTVFHLYKKNFSSIPTIFSHAWRTQFEPTTFSVLSYATVGSVTQRLLAIVARDKTVKKESTAFDVVIKKIYWL